MKEDEYVGIPIHEGTIILNADGVSDPIFLVVNKSVDSIRIRCRVSCTHAGCVPDGAVLELDGTPVLPVIDWCVTEQEIDQSAIWPESRLRMIVTDTSMDRRELRLTVIDC